MKISEVISSLEAFAPPSLQELYDNTGLLTGSSDRECTGIITALDATEEVVLEAIEKNCNCIVAHHPIIFGGLKHITGNNYVERAVITAIKHDIAIYAIHTNLDNVIHGVNGRIADQLGLVNCYILQPKSNILRKLQVFIPLLFAEKLRNAVFEAGAGHIGNYSECSFNTAGTGTFRPGVDTHPFSGTTGQRKYEEEMKVEVIFPAWLERKIKDAMLQVHPYEEVAYDIISLQNQYQDTGSGLVGELQVALSEKDLLERVKQVFSLKVIRHTPLTGKMIKKIALCGGAGSFLIGTAAAAGADCYITSDIKYHEFFDADGRLLVADIGHFESEQFTIELLFDVLREKFPTFAVLKTGVNTNPVRYFL